MSTGPVTEPMLSAWDGEELIVRRDGRSGAWILIALHSTALGPAAGGTRMKPYRHADEALSDVLRLSEGMTYKFATPGLPFGGAKAVVMVPADLPPEERLGLLRRYGELISELRGRFLTGPDVGTSPADMDVIAETAGPHVFCRTPAAGGAGDPGPYTALGVFTAIEVACEQLGRSLAGSRIVVQGAGDVGGPLIERLQAAGCDVVFSDVDERVIQHFRDGEGVEFVSPETALTTACDVLAPCALGGVLNSETIPQLRCKGVVGSANNQLERAEDARLLASRRVLYAPDFVANVGGAMAMPGMEALGWSAEHAAAQVINYVGTTLRNIFADAQRKGTTTDAAARRMAERNLATARSRAAT